MAVVVEQLADRAFPIADVVYQLSQLIHGSHCLLVKLRIVDQLADRALGPN